MEPLRVELVLACSCEHAFSTWTKRLSQWWPPSHTVSGTAEAIVLEPYVDGRIFERTNDGREIDWGLITSWDPPHRLTYLWHIRRDRADPTDVDIRFFAVDSESTRMEITHTGWERLGADAEVWRDANRGGWSGLLPHFVAHCTAPASTDKERAR